MTVVCDTSPLLLLARTDRLTLLRTLYSTIVVPNAVLREIRVREIRVREDVPAQRVHAFLEQSHCRRTEAR